MKKFILTISSFLMLSAAYSSICLKLHDRHDKTPCFDEPIVANDLRDPGYGYYEDVIGVFFTDNTKNKFYIRFCTETYLGGVCFSSMRDNNFDTYKDSIKSFEIVPRTSGLGSICLIQHGNFEGTGICYEEGTYNQGSSPNLPGNFNDQISSVAFDNVNSKVHPLIILYDDRDQEGNNIKALQTDTNISDLGDFNDKTASFKWCTTDNVTECEDAQVTKI